MRNREDYNNLTFMSIKDAVGIISNKELVYYHFGNLLPDSPYEVDFERAELYMALEKLLAYMDYTEKQGVDLSKIIMESRPVIELAPCSTLNGTKEEKVIPQEEIKAFLSREQAYKYSGRSMVKPIEFTQPLEDTSGKPRVDMEKVMQSQLETQSATQSATVEETGETEKQYVVVEETPQLPIPYTVDDVDEFDETDLVKEPRKSLNKLKSLAEIKLFKKSGE